MTKDRAEGCTVDSDEEKPKGKPKGTDQQLDALGPPERGNRKMQKSAQRGLQGDCTQNRICDGNIGCTNHLADADKVVQRKAVIEVQPAKETMGTGGGRHCEDKRRRSRQRGLLLVDGTEGLLRNACNVIILKLFQLLNCHQLDEGGRK